jgi:hypothetical protein
MKRRRSDMVHRLPSEIRPRRDLWPGIRAAIEADGAAAEPPQRRSNPAVRRFSVLAATHQGRLVAAAILIVLCAATLLVVLVGGAPEADQLDPTMALVEAEIADAVNAYRSARDELLDALNRYERQYGSLLVSELEQQFRSIDDDVNRALAAVRQRPNDAAGAGWLVAMLDSNVSAISFTYSMLEQTGTEETNR